MNGHTRRAVALTTTGILLAATMVAGGWWLGQRGERRQAPPGVTTAAPTTPPAAATSPTAGGGPTQTTRQLATGTWQRLPAAPLPGQSSGYAGVWTGTELLVTGPAFSVQAGIPRGRNVGAAYNPASRTWRTLPPAPGPVQSIEGGYQAVWTGRELLGWGMGVNAAYDPGDQPMAPALRVGRRPGGHGLDRPAGADLGWRLLR